MVGSGRNAGASIAQVAAIVGRVIDSLIINSTNMSLVGVWVR